MCFIKEYNIIYSLNPINGINNNFFNIIMKNVLKITEKHEIINIINK